MDNYKNDNKIFEAVGDGCKEDGIMMPTYFFKTNDDKIQYVAKEYFADKKVYLATGTWPEKKFLQRDMIWEYYYYLKITDCSLKLDKYLDFNYDTETWTRKELENIINKYGKKILFKLATYLELRLGISFDEWYARELENKDLEYLNQVIKDYNSSRKNN